jgi:hypothetical protein
MSNQLLGGIVLFFGLAIAAGAIVIPGIRKKIAGIPTGLVIAYFGGAIAGWWPMILNLFQ